MEELQAELWGATSRSADAKKKQKEEGTERATRGENDGRGNR